MNNDYITVGALTRYIKYRIDNDSNLQEVYLKGEISNFKPHSRGHYYFTIKDEESRISAIMFASNTKNVKFVPEDGMKVLVKGKISVFPQTGNYQIYVSEMQEDGIGNLYALYEQLKKKLASEGYFDESHKKQIPKIPSKIGIVTAPTGAAIKDIISTIKRRWPICEIILFPALVQGEDAHKTIVDQIKNAENFNIDTLIVGRGGGSIEDLWPFNEEDVAIAIYESNIPIISAVGHEIDFTIADYVADLRAPTPTGAAELAVPDKNEMLKYISNLDTRINKQIINLVTINRNNLNKIKKNYIFINPMSIYQTKEMIFDSVNERLKYSLTNLIHVKEKDYINILSKSIILKDPSKLLDKSKNKYINIISKLDALSPLKTIARGYTITKKNNKVITSVKDIKKGDILSIEFKDGNINSEVL